MDKYKQWADKIQAFRFHDAFHLGLGDIRLARGDGDDLMRDLMEADALLAERDALRAEVTRLKVDKELLNREYEAVREHMAALSDESRTLFVAVMESGNKDADLMFANKALRDRVAELESKLALAWQEICTIRAAINADPEESTTDEVNRVAAERDKLRAENEWLKKTLAIPQGYRLQPISEFDAMESARIEAEARVAELNSISMSLAADVLAIIGMDESHTADQVRARVVKWRGQWNATGTRAAIAKERE